MLVTDLPTLPVSEYDRAHILQREVLRALSYAERHANSAEAINDFFAAVGGGAEPLPPTQAVVSSGTVSLLPASGTAPAQGDISRTVADSTPTYRLAATSAVVTDGQMFEVGGGTITISVAANVVTAEFVAEA